MIGAGLLIRTSIALSTLELGFSADNVLTMRTALSEPGSTAAVAQKIEAVLTRVRAIPGVEVVASSVGLPLQDRVAGLSTLSGAKRRAGNRRYGFRPDHLITSIRSGFRCSWVDHSKLAMSRPRFQ